MPTFRKRGNKWRAEVARQGVRRSETFESKQAAVAWAARQEAEIMAGVRGEVPNLTVAALLKRYREEVSPGKKGARWEIIRLVALERDTLAKVSLRRLEGPADACSLGGDRGAKRLQAPNNRPGYRQQIFCFKTSKKQGVPPEGLNPFSGQQCSLALAGMTHGL